MVNGFLPVHETPLFLHSLHILFTDSLISYLLQVQTVLLPEYFVVLTTSYSSDFFLWELTGLAGDSAEQGLILQGLSLISYCLYAASRGTLVLRAGVPSCALCVLSPLLHCLGCSHPAPTKPTPGVPWNWVCLEQTEL